MNPTDDDMKKLVMHSLLQVDLEEEGKQRPMSKKEERAVLAQFSDKDFPDTFHLAIVREKGNDGKVFSQSALERFLHTFRLYLGGRILGQFDKTQKSPEVFYVHVKVEHLTKAEYDKLMQG